MSNRNSTLNKSIQILVIEDDPDDIDIIKEAFASGKMQPKVVIATDGEMALNYLRNDNVTIPDLILLDLNLPKVDGRTLLAEIRKDQLLKRIPVVVMTTSSAPVDQDTCRKYGINSYVSKPDNLDDFSQIVQNIEDYWLNFNVVEAAEV